MSAGTVLWQAQDHTYWTQSRDGSTSMARIGGGFFFTFFLALISSYIFLRAWRNLPASWKTRFWLGVIALVFGIGWHSFLITREAFAIGMYSGSTCLAWIVVWAVLFLTALLFAYSLRYFLRWLSTWGILKRMLLALAVLTLFLALFRAEENWRGKRAWKNYRREWEAKGEKFDFADFVPSSVPDEQNFAMAPIVVSSYAARSNQRYDEETMPAATNVNRMAMECYRTNQFYFTNATIGMWQMARPTNLKGWQDYYRTRFVTNNLTPDMPPPPGMSTPVPTVTNGSSREIIALDTHEFPIGDQPQSPPDDVLLALSRYDAALAELRQAALRPQSRFPLNYAVENPADIRLPHLPDLKRCAVVLQLRAIAELQAGQGEQALADVKLMLRLAESIRTEPVEISYMVRLSIIGIAIQPVWEGLAARQWSETEMKELNRTLQALDMVAEWQSGLRAERASAIGTIEYLRKHRDETAFWMVISISPRFFEMLDGLGNFIPNLPDTIKQLLDAFMECLPGDEISRMAMKLPPDGWYELNKVAVARLYQQQMFQIANLEKHLIARQKMMEVTSFLDQKRDSRSFGPQDVLLYELIPAIGSLAQRIAAIQNAVDMANVACALERYRLVQGSYPAELTALVPDFIPDIPPDLVNGGRLQYHPSNERRFTLYSIGWNGKDDGGVVGTNQFGRFDPRLGDWVWKYPAQ